MIVLPLPIQPLLIVIVELVELLNVPWKRLLNVVHTLKLKQYRLLVIQEKCANVALLLLLQLALIIQVILWPLGRHNPAQALPMIAVKPITAAVRLVLTMVMVQLHGILAPEEPSLPIQPAMVQAVPLAVASLVIPAVLYSVTAVVAEGLRQQS